MNSKSMAGWIGFAGILMVLLGGLSIFQGLIALLEDDYYVPTQAGYLVFDITGWGWIMLIWGIVLVLVGLALLNGASWARWVSIVLVGVNVFGQLALSRPTRRSRPLARERAGASRPADTHRMPFPCGGAHPAAPSHRIRVVIATRRRRLDASLEETAGCPSCAVRPVASPLGYGSCAWSAEWVLGEAVSRVSVRSCRSRPWRRAAAAPAAFPPRRWIAGVLRVLRRAAGESRGASGAARWLMAAPRGGGGLRRRRGPRLSPGMPEPSKGTARATGTRTEEQ